MCVCKGGVGGYIFMLDIFDWYTIRFFLNFGKTCEVLNDFRLFDDPGRLI